MEFFSKPKIYDFMGKSKFLIISSLILMILSLAILFTRGFNYGIDFAGGTLIQIQYDTKAPIEKIRENLALDPMFQSASITRFGSDEEIVIRISTSSDSMGGDVEGSVHRLLKDTGNFEIRRTDVVGPKVGGELRQKGLMAIFVSIIAISIYIATRFEWRFGIATVAGLIHDLILTVGLLVLFKIEINLDILAAVLTLLGYSLNDTIIVFDRIREELKKSKNMTLFEIINLSVSKTLSRTILTSLTTFFVVFSLFVFGGEVIRGFSFTLLVGIIIGTYSSIFVTAPFLKLMNFNVDEYKDRIAKKEKERKEKEKMRSMYEKGIV